MRRYKETHSTFDAFADKVAFQMNDTHPTIAVAELMRVLMDENDLGWTRSWELTTQVQAACRLWLGHVQYFAVSQTNTQMHASPVIVCHRCSHFSIGGSTYFSSAFFGA